MSSTNFNPGPTISQRLTPEIAPFKSLEARVYDYLRVAQPAVVVAFHADANTVDVQLVMNDVSQQNVNAPNFPVNMQQSATPVAVLQDLPVIFPSAGGWSVTFPIAAGDECLVIFADVDFDSWFESGYNPNGGNTPQNPSLKHSFSNGCAIFGVRSLPNALADWSTSSMQVRNEDGSVVIDLSADGVKITGAFGCNGATPQTPYASGGPSAGTLAETTLLANNIRAALVAMGIMS